MDITETDVVVITPGRQPRRRHFQAATFRELVRKVRAYIDRLDDDVTLELEASYLDRLALE